MRSKEFDVDHDQGNQHTESSIEGSMENSILVAKPQLAIKHRKNHMTRKQQENQCLISTYDLDLNMHLLIDRSDTTIGKRNRKQKISCLRSNHQRSSMKIASKVFGHGSPTDVAEVELVKTVGADPRSYEFE